MLRKPITTLLLFVCTLCSAQSVRFLNNNIDGAIAMAQSRDQLIFVDTYAPWCIPCKKQEKEFRDPDLANYFNRTFVNIRIDMDSPEGKQLHKKYDVIFLPTMMILDPTGRVKFKVDQAITAKNLLDIAQKIAEPEIYRREPSYASTSAPLRKPVEPAPTPTPTPRNVETEELVKKLPKAIQENPDLETEEVVVQPSNPSEVIKVDKDFVPGIVTEEKIIHVFDPNSDNLPPEILKQEAYLKLQMMDGSHNEAARKYLDTQEDWSSELNMRFILDFLHSSDSREFQHVINNRKAYEDLLGKERVLRNISILVYDRLNRGFPRPTFQETQDLFSYIDPVKYEQFAYEHYMESLYSRNKHIEYASIAEKYIAEIHSKNDQVYYRLANIYTEDKRPGKDIRSLYCINKAVEINPHNYQYFDLKAYIHYLDENKTEALKSARMAKSLAVKNNQKTQAIETLINMIIEDL
jgi:thiol-disulfide isomerase/thioredoxin